MDTKDEKVIIGQNPEKKQEVITQVESVEHKEASVENEVKMSETEVRELKEKIEKTDIDDSLKLQASAQANDIKALEDEKKIQKLMDLAKLKGVVYAVHVAKNMGDPFVLDKLHDALAIGGYYRNLTL